jgi:hypothetical protein
MTLGQASLKWLLAEPRVVTVLPNIYDDEQLSEFADAADKPELSAVQMARIGELNTRNFDVVEEPMAYKGVTWDEYAAPALPARERAVS